MQKVLRDSTGKAYSISTKDLKETVSEAGAGNEDQMPKDHLWPLWALVFKICVMGKLSPSHDLHIFKSLFKGEVKLLR